MKTQSYAPRLTNLIHPSSINLQFDTSCASDTDGDGIVDGEDQFPNDAAASQDYDGDGSPDDWNLVTTRVIRLPASQSITTMMTAMESPMPTICFRKTVPRAQIETEMELVTTQTPIPIIRNSNTFRLMTRCQLVIDERLRSCLEEGSKGLVNASQLEEMDCSGVESLEGVPAFIQLC